MSADKLYSKQGTGHSKTLTKGMNTVAFDPEDVSISVPSSLLTLTGVGERTPFYRRNDALAGLYLRSIRSRDAQGFVFRLVPTRDGIPLEHARWEGSPGVAVVRDGESSLILRFTGPHEIVVEGNGLGLRAEGFPGYFDWIRPLPKGRWRYHASSRLLTLDVVSLDGTLEVDAPWDKLHSTQVNLNLQPDADGVCRLLLRERDPKVPIFSDSAEPSNEDPSADFAAWADPLVEGLPDRTTALRAAHILWSHQAGPDGLLPGRGILAGKSWMPAVYGWDQCFCSVGVAPGDPQLAWDQLALFFLSQDAGGCIPPLMQPDRIMWQTTMPPLQGWCLTQLRRVPDCITPERLAWFTPRLDAYVRWWLARDEDGDGLPEYHHGNDSGWDNGTIFGEGMPVVSPDLAAYLVDCCDALEQAYADLELTMQAKFWGEQKARLIGLVLSRLIEGDRLVARRSPGGEIPVGDSLQPLIALRLGKHLPEAVRASAIAALRDPQRFLAPFGPATEALSSPLHADDAYWRGPVWAPTTWLISEALDGLGEYALAEEMLKLFCSACTMDAFAENIDPITGRGLRDRGYAWTAAVYLMAQRRLLTATQD